MAISVPQPAPSEVMRPAPLAREAILRDNRPAAEKAKGNETPFKAANKDAQARLEAAQKRGQELADYNRQHENPRDTMRENLKPTRSLSPTEINQLNRVDPTLAGEVRQFDTYSSVTEEMGRTGKTAAEICASRQPPIQQGEYDKARTDTLSRMSQMGYVREAIPGFDTMTPQEQLNAVDAFAATHRGVREIYIGRMRDIARRAIAMPEAPAPVAEQNKPRMDLLNTQQDEGTTQINRALGLQGAQGPNQELSRSQIDAAASRGDAGRATLDVYDALLRNNGVQEPALFRRHFQLERQIAQMKAQGRPETEIQPLVAEISQVGQTLQFEQNRGTFIALEARLTSQVYGEVDPTGARVGGIQAEVQRLVQNNREIDSLRRQSTAPAELTPEQQKQQGERTILQEELRGEMMGGLESSVQEAFLRDYDQLDQINQRKVEADAIDATEKGKVRSAEAIRVVHKQQERHGVETDVRTGRKVVHREEIGADVRRIAQDGDEGVRRIALRNLAEGEHPVVALYETDERGIIRQGPNGQPIPKYFVDEKGLPYKDGVSQQKIPATWETVQYDQLSTQDRGLLDEVYTQQGDRLAQKVMVDYFFGLKPPLKQVDMLGSKADLKLTDGQQADLGRYFGEDRMKESFKQSREYKRIKDILKEKGIDAGKGGPGLLVIIAMILGGATFGKKRED